MDNFKEEKLELLATYIGKEVSYKFLHTNQTGVLLGRVGFGTFWKVAIDKVESVKKYKGGWINVYYKNIFI